MRPDAGGARAVTNLALDSIVKESGFNNDSLSSVPRGVHVWTGGSLQAVMVPREVPSIAGRPNCKQVAKDLH